MTTATPKPIADYQKKRAHRDRGMAPDGAKGLAMLARWSSRLLIPDTETENQKGRFSQC